MFEEKQREKNESNNVLCCSFFFIDSLQSWRKVNFEGYRVR